MKSNSNVSITIEYQILGSTKWESVELSPEDYFDLDEGEEIVWDSVPMRNHAADYLGVDKSKIGSTKLKITDSSTQVTKLITETFWNNGKNRVIERTDTGPGIEYWELILEGIVSEQPVIWEVLRLDKLKGILTPSYHGFLQLNDDGSETETRVR